MAEDTPVVAMDDDAILARAREIEQQRGADRKAALRAFVASDHFAALRVEADATLRLAPTETHLSYLALMMTRLADDYPA